MSIEPTMTPLPCFDAADAWVARQSGEFAQRDVGYVDVARRSQVLTAIGVEHIVRMLADAHKGTYLSLHLTVDSTAIRGEPLLLSDQLAKHGRKFLPSHLLVFCMAEAQHRQGSH